MRKFMTFVTTMSAVGCLAATSYMALKNKRTMLDVLIEEIETMK